MRTLPAGVAADATLDRFPFAEMADDALSAALSEWWAVMGTPWFGTPGTAGMNALETRIKAVRTWHADWKLQGGPFDRATESPYRPQQFDRRPDSHALWLHGYDVTRMYSTAAGVTDASPGRLHRGPREFDKSLAGWWKVDISPWCWDELPDPAGYPGRHHRPGADRWVTTPTLRLLADLHDQGAHGGFTITESWVGKGRPIFKEWNQALEKLYREGGREMRAAAKAAGRESIGLLNSETYSTYRPDWHFAVIAQARSNLWRKLWRIYGQESRVPLAVDVDCVWYSGITPDPMDSLPLSFTVGDNPGNVKHKGTVSR